MPVPPPELDYGNEEPKEGRVMSMLLTVAGTILFMALWPVLANIWDVSQFGYIAARWAIALWVLTVDVVLFAAALWTGGYIG